MTFSDVVDLLLLILSTVYVFFGTWQHSTYDISLAVLFYVLSRNTSWSKEKR